MEALGKLVTRNLKLFFRDRTSVFFSLLSVFIIIGLYALFLGNIMAENLKEMAGEGSHFLVDTWIMAGILSVTTMTTVMGAYGTMVDDLSRKISRDFTSSPVKRSQLAASYIISSFAIGIIMTAAALGLAEIYIVAHGGSLIGTLPLLKVLGIILLSVFSNSSLLFFLVSFIKSSNTFATASTIIGTIIGFIAGIYIPMGSLPSAVQTFVKIFPVSHTGALLRQAMMEQAVAQSFSSAPKEAVAGLEKMMGIVFYSGNDRIPPYISFLIIAGTGILFYILAVIRISAKKK